MGNGLQYVFTVVCCRRRLRLLRDQDIGGGGEKQKTRTSFPTRNLDEAFGYFVRALEFTSDWVSTKFS